MAKVQKPLRVVPFTRDRVDNPYPGGTLPWQEYHAVRNDLVRACREHGPVGPMGLVTISADVEDPYREALLNFGSWEFGDPNPRYFLLDDQLNHERYCYLELPGETGFTPAWMHSVAAVLRKHDGWGLGVNHIPDAYVLIFGRKLMVRGSRIAKCTDDVEVVNVVTELFRRGHKKWWEFWK